MHTIEKAVELMLGILSGLVHLHEHHITHRDLKPNNFLLSADWQTRYGITPALVETFVDSTRYRGTCYQAANWIHLGRTQGRGRQDRTHAAQGTRKDIWVYPLQARWQGILQGGAERASAPNTRRPNPMPGFTPVHRTG